MSDADSVGTLLADIANLITEGRRILGLADKRHWGLDEHEQLRALGELLDEARKDFQELAPLVHGASHYEHDRRHESVEELRALRVRFHNHTLTLKDWARSGGPIDPVWTRETHTLKRDLHRAQCRAARRIFTSDHESSQRCLGAFLVHRIQRRHLPRSTGTAAADTDRPGLLREELRTCAAVGGFERLGEQDIAFICDFCDGHIVWEDLEDVPLPRPSHQGVAGLPSTPAASAPLLSWQVSGATASEALDKVVVSAPIAIANHMAPLYGDWQARLLCPFCEEEARRPQDEDDDHDDEFMPTDEFVDLAALQEHLEWQHSATALPNALPVSPLPSGQCRIM